MVGRTTKDSQEWDAVLEPANYPGSGLLPGQADQPGGSLVPLPRHPRLSPSVSGNRSLLEPSGHPRLSHHPPPSIRTGQQPPPRTSIGAHGNKRTLRHWSPSSSSDKLRL